MCAHVRAPGEYLSSGDKELGGGGDHREGQKENGAGPPGHPEDGHYWKDCPSHWRSTFKVRHHSSSFFTL